MTGYVVWLDDCDADSVAAVGGKSAGLGELIKAGFSVPPGFAVTTAAYEAFLDEATLPSDVERAIRQAYAELGARLGTPPPPVAVRSSATAEDLATASFAGQLETFLWIRGGDDVVRHVRRAFMALDSPSALAYRKHAGIVDRPLMGIVVQHMVDARAAGVMFTINPVNGDPSKIAIEAAWGLGQAVVGGEVDPDRYLVDKVTLEPIERTIATKELAYRFDPAAGTVVARSLPDDRRCAPCIDTDEAVELAQIGKRIERHYRGAQDVEWAIAGDLGSAQVHILQSRAETVWSQRDQVAPIGEVKGSAVEYVLGNLLTRSRSQGRP
jgi:pyruvate,water dikinase